MPIVLALAAVAVLILTALLVRRLVAPDPGSATGLLTHLAVVVSTAALVAAARGASGLAVAVAALGLGAVTIGLFGTSQRLR